MSGGCIFWDIRDEVRNTNSRLGEVESSLAGTNASLGQTNDELKVVQSGLERLDRTNELIGGVEQGLHRLDSTNESLVDMHERLALLRSIEQSLMRLDTHLAALRQTIGRIDGMIPFLDLGGDEPIESGGAPVAAGDHDVPIDAPATSAGAATAAAPAGATPAPARRDALLGAWVSRFPNQSLALVLLDEGRFVRHENISPSVPGLPTNIIAGTWKRHGAAFELTEVPASAAAPAQPARPATERFEIIAQTTRALTLRSPDGALLILAKP